MPIGYCSFTGRPIESVSDAIWDDGEWISWEYINEHQERQAWKADAGATNPELTEVFECLLAAAINYKDLTGRYLDIFGELGELYAEANLGLTRNKPNAPGSDGRLGNDYVEVKTISPLKQNDTVRVKRTGNFNKLYVVRISQNFDVEARMIDRAKLKKGTGKIAKIRFSDMQPADDGAN